MKNISVVKAKKQDTALLDQLQKMSFEVNRVYFRDGTLPVKPPEEAEKHTFATLYSHPDYALLSIVMDDQIVGGAMIHHLGNENREIKLYFIAPEFQSKHIGTIAFQLIEDSFPNTKRWKLITPVEVIRNAVFYVNKCGYHIVQVLDYDKEKNTGVFVFEKKMKI